MKKLLFFMLGLPALCFGQWTEDFDSGTSLPAGWVVINNGDPNGWEIGVPSFSAAAQSGTNVAKIRYGSTAHDDYLITKAINVQVGVSDNISFYVKSLLAPTFEENYEVLLSTTNQTAADFTVTLQSVQKASGTWTKKSFDVSQYAGQTVYVAIHATDTDQFELNVDTFVVSSNALATAEVTKAKDVVGVYPNPFTDVLNISKADKIRSLSVIDSSGKLIKTIERPSSVLQLEDLKQGVYILNIDMKDGSKQTVKAIKK